MPLANKAMSYKIFLINLDRSSDRLERFSKRATELSITCTRISAVDAEKLSESEMSSSGRGGYFRGLVRGEIACYKSHIKALRTFLESEVEYGVILEDDAVLSQDFNELIAALIGSHRHSSHWDLVKLDGVKSGRISRGHIGKGHYLVEFKSVPGLATGVVWTKKAAERFLTLHEYGPVKRPFDVDLRSPWQFDAIVYTVWPSLVIAEEISSGHETTIKGRWGGKARVTHAREKISKIAFNLDFALRNLRYNMRRIGIIQALVSLSGRNRSLELKDL